MGQPAKQCGDTGRSVLGSSFAEAFAQQISRNTVTAVSNNSNSLIPVLLAVIRSKSEIKIGLVAL